MAGKRNKTYTVVDVDNGRVMNLHGAFKIRRNFSVYEFACSDGSDTVLISGTTLDWLQEIRDITKTPLRITSGYRTYSYNRDVAYRGIKKKVLNSSHVMGRAVDIAVPKFHSVDSFGKIIESIAGRNCGIGKYYKYRFIHLDSRKGHFRW